MSNKYGIDTSHEHKTGCPRCIRKGQDKSRNNLHVYGEGKGAFCWACEFTIPSDEWLEEHGEIKDDEEEFEEVTTREAITPEENEKIKSYTSTDGKGFRGIRKETNSFFGVRYSYDESTGEPVKEFVPTTINGELVGYRTRIFPKDFTQPIGKVGKECDLVGQFRFKNGGNTIIIAGGEIKQRAAYQMLLDDQKSKGKTEWEPNAVVSPTIGESGAYKQVQAQYEFFSKWKKIIVMMDADDAGREAAQKIAKVLPRGKVFIMETRYKDADEYIKLGKEKEFIQDYWKVKPYTPAGVHASTGLYRAALERLDLKMISLPKFMKKAAGMLGNGIVKKEICLILAKTSIGKTTLMSGLAQHLALNEPEEITGVLSLEADAGKFSLNLLSYHLQKPLHRMDKDARLAYLEREDIKASIDKLYEKPDGTPTLYVCDDRGANWEQIKEKVLEMIISMGITILVVDPYSDLLSGMSVSEQEEVATWFKKIMKEYDITPIIVSHVRKSSTGANAGPLTEDDAQGSSFLVKAAGQTLSLERDKQSESNVERNRTYINILKNRDFSETGPAGSMYFDIQTSNLYDYDEWSQENPQEF